LALILAVIAESLTYALGLERSTVPLGGGGCAVTATAEASATLARMVAIVVFMSRPLVMASSHVQCGPSCRSPKCFQYGSCRRRGACASQRLMVHSVTEYWVASVRGLCPASARSRTSLRCDLRSSLIVMHIPCHCLASARLWRFRRGSLELRPDLATWMCLA